MIRALLSFMLAGCTLVGVAAQTTPVGAASSVLVVQVKDDGQQPVADATVKIGGVAGVFRTDKDGIVQLTVGAGREYGIRVESTGFYPAKVDGVEVSAGEPSLVEVELKRAAVVSENTYWRGAAQDDFRAIRTLPQVKLEMATKAELRGGVWRASTTVKNPSQAPALMVRLKPVGETTGARMLPAIMSDNYLILMPGEGRTVTIEVAEADARGEKMAVAVEGFNVAAGR